jgi:uncharacterized membrane protein
MDFPQSWRSTLASAYRKIATPAVANGAVVLDINAGEYSDSLREAFNTYLIAPGIYQTVGAIMLMLAVLSYFLARRSGFAWRMATGGLLLLVVGFNIELFLNTIAYVTET